MEEKVDGTPLVVDESGPELVEMPRGVRMLTADQTGQALAGRNSGQVSIADHPIYVSGGGDPKGTAAMIDAKVMISNAAQRECFVRNLPQLQVDNTQTS